MTEYKSKHGVVNRPQAEIYMAFTDLRNFLQFLPEDRKQDVSADFDTLSAKVQGINIGVKVTRREPYSYIELKDNGAPFSFTVMLHFDVVPGDAHSTDLYIVVDADLNFMMKMMIGGKLQEALDRVVDGLVDVSNGRIPKDIPDDIKAKMHF